MVDLKALFKRMDRFTVSAVSAASGISRAAIIDIRRGQTSNPGILTIEKLEQAVSQLENPSNQDEINTVSRKSAKAASAKAVAK